MCHRVTGVSSFDSFRSSVTSRPRINNYKVQSNTLSNNYFKPTTSISCNIGLGITCDGYFACAFNWRDAYLEDDKLSTLSNKDGYSNGNRTIDLSSLRKKKISDDFKDECKELSNTGGYKCHPIECYHVSCQSYRPKLNETNDWGGIVLYMKDGKVDWYCNNVHCKTGYIIIKKSKDIEHLPTGGAIVHGQVYYSVFNQLPKNIIGSGFAFYCGQSKFNSWSLNASNDTYHDNSNKMGDKEKEWIKKAIDNWTKNGTQNTRVTEKLVFHEIVK